LSVKDTSLDSVTVYLTDVDGVPFTDNGRRYVGSDDADMITGTDDADQFFGGLGSDMIDGKRELIPRFLNRPQSRLASKETLQRE